MSANIYIEGNFIIGLDTVSRSIFFKMSLSIASHLRDGDDNFGFFSSGVIPRVNGYQQFIQQGRMESWSVDDPEPESQTVFPFADILDKAGDPYPDADFLDALLNTSLGGNGGLSSVSTDASLNGDGTLLDPLSVAIIPNVVLTVDGVAVDNSDPFNPKILDQSWMNRFEGGIGPTVIGSTWVDLTPIIGALAARKQPSAFVDFITYDALNVAFVANPLLDYFYTFNVSLALTGDVPVTGSDDAFEFAITRPVISTDPNFEVLRHSIYLQSKDQPSGFIERELYGEGTFVFEGGADPYQVPTPPFVAGFKIQARKVSGDDMTLEGNQDIRFSKQ